MLIGGLIVTHGNLAHELLAAAEKIEGAPLNLRAVTLDWEESVETSTEKIRASLESVVSDRGAIIFTDMFGGTPSNIALSFFERGRIEIVTGVNLPMLVKFSSLQVSTENLTDLARAIQDRGARSIRVASELLTDANGGSRS